MGSLLLPIPSFLWGLDLGLEYEHIEERVPVNWGRDRPIPVFCHLAWESERIGTDRVRAEGKTGRDAVRLWQGKGPLSLHPSLSLW